MTGSGEELAGQTHSVNHGADELEVSPTLLSDVEVLQAIANGDKNALGILYNRFVARLLGAARRMLSNSQDAEDIVHDVFVEVWRRAADYDDSRGSVAAWLLIRTRSRALDRLKSPSLRRHESLDDGVCCEDDFSSTATNLVSDTWDPTQDLDGAHVWMALADLPDEQRVVVELAYFEGLTLIEVGDCLGIPAGTVKSRLSRAVATLRERFN